jgi:diacylglycerol kinase
MGWSLALGIGIAKDVGCEAWLFVMGFVSFANCYAMWFLALDA